MNTLPSQLIIYSGLRRVGSLRVAAGVYQLDYDGEWLAQPDSLALSLRLPLEQSHYEGKEVEYFFDNLLPEERVRRVLAQKHGVSAENTYALLCIVGRECAGAFSLCPPEEPPCGEGRDAQRYRLLEPDEVAGLLEQLPVNPLLSGEARVSLSLAGAQNKIPMLRRGGRFYLPQDGAPSNCILKPVLPVFSDSVANELFCLRLARKVGVNSVEASAVTFGGKAVLCVNRYDRVTKGAQVQRLHQEDFCQVLGYPHGMKYQREGGPSFADCAGAIRRYSVTAALDLLQLFRWAVFNVCIGNADAHAKNLSFLHTPGGPKLAPFYDLLSTTIYEYFDDRFAMSIGGAATEDALSRSAWEGFAHDLGISPAAVFQTAQTICHRLASRVDAVAATLGNDGFPAWQIEGLVRHVSQRTILVLRSIGN